MEGRSEGRRTAAFSRMGNTLASGQALQVVHEPGGRGLLDTVRPDKARQEILPPGIAGRVAGEQHPQVLDVRMLRYEDLVTRPDEELAEVQRFVGIDPRPSGIEVRQGLNDSYFEGWEQRRGNPLRRAWYDRAARRLEPRVNRFGYSLAPPRTLSTAAAPIAGSTQSGA